MRLIRKIFGAIVSWRALYLYGVLIAVIGIGARIVVLMAAGAAAMAVAMIAAHRAHDAFDRGVLAAVERLQRRTTTAWDHERSNAITVIARGPDALGESDSLRSLAGVYLCAARNHRAAGGGRVMIALRLEQLAGGLEDDSRSIEALARVLARPTGQAGQDAQEGRS